MKKDNLKILFYAGNSYSFPSLLIWHVYEISQLYPTILLAEKLDFETERILNNKKFFPKLEKIIYIQHPGNCSKLIIKNNRLLYQEAKKVFQDYKPDIVITPGKNIFPFELYLRRIAKRTGVVNICPLGPQIGEPEQITSWVRLISPYSQKPELLPFSVKVILTRVKKQLGHFLFYWILPLMVGEMPFIKEPGCILCKKNFGKTADYYIVFSKQDYKLSLEEGVPSEKLYLLTRPYPLEYKEIREVLKRRFIVNKFSGSEDKKRILTLMWPGFKIGFGQGNCALISEEEMKKNRIRIIALIAETLRGWKIFIKPHPLLLEKDFLEVKKDFESIFNNLKVVKPGESAERYMEISDVIVGLPPASSTLYTASLTSPEKIILSLDLQQEILGDCYKNFKGIEYIDKEEKFIDILRQIQSNQYRKNYQEPVKEKLREKEFSSFIEILKYLFNKEKC